MLWNKLNIAQVPGGGTLAYIGQVFSSTPSSPSHTFSNVSLGTTGAKLLVLCFNANGSGDATMTVGGSSATRQIAQTSGSPYTAIFTIDSVTSSTADIVVTRTTLTSATVFVYAVYGSGFQLATAVDATSPFSYTKTFVSGEHYIGIGRHLSTATSSWTNATQNDSRILSGLTGASVASYSPAAAGSRTITFTPSNTTSAWQLSLVVT